MGIIQKSQQHYQFRNWNWGAHHHWQPISGEGTVGSFFVQDIFLVALGLQDVFLANAGLFLSGCTFAWFFFILFFLARLFFGNCLSPSPPEIWWPPLRARLHGKSQPGLRSQPGKGGWNFSPDSHPRKSRGGLSGGRKFRADTKVSLRPHRSRRGLASLGVRCFKNCPFRDWLPLGFRGCPDSLTIANKNELSIHDVSKTKMAGTERRQVVHQSSRKQRKRQGSVGTETANYKSQMDYQNIDFDGDKVKQYEAVREAMARIYEEPSFFRPPFTTPTPDKEVDQEERAAVEKQRKIDKDLIKKGYTPLQWHRLCFRQM